MIGQLIDVEQISLDQQAIKPGFYSLVVEVEGGCSYELGSGRLFSYLFFFLVKLYGFMQPQRL